MKTAVVTGASYGIGESASEALLQAGWKIYGVSRSRPKFRTDRFVWLGCDLSKSEDIDQALQTIREPTLDALVSNAGIVIEEAASEVTLSSYQKTFSVNVLAPMLLVAALRDKIRHATIISVSSVSDRLPDSGIALYCSSKAANTQYFDALARELLDAKVYTLLPDYVDTPMLRTTPPAATDFNWDVIIHPADVAKLCINLVAGHLKLESGANIIVVTNALKGSWNSVEKLYGFNTDTGELTRLRP